MKGLKCRIDDILNVTTYDEHADLRGLHADHKDSDQLFQLRELQKITGRFPRNVLLGAGESEA